MNLFDSADLPDPAPDPDGGWGRTIDQVATLMALGVAAKMEEYGFLLHATDAIPPLTRWLVQAANRAGYPDPDTFAALFGELTPLIDGVTHGLLDVMVEERPGTDPWSHTPTIPIPITVVHLVTAGATLIVDIAGSNAKFGYASEVLRSLGKMHEVLFSHQLRNDPDIATLNVLIRGTSVEVHGVVVRLPQSGVAHLARMFESAASRLRSGSLLTQGSADDATALAASFESNALTLRDLNTRFGQSAGPRHGS